MKKIRYIILLFLLTNVIGLWAYDFVSDGLYYDIIDQEGQIVAVTYQTSDVLHGNLVRWGQSIGEKRWRNG